MSTEAKTVSKGALWGGRVASALPCLGMVVSAGMKLAAAPQFLEQFQGKFGYPGSTARPIGVVELLCVVIYLVPRTSVLGAVLMTGYLGGAVATHVRVGDPFIAPILFGVLAWLGLFLRDPRIRALLPLRQPS